MSFRWCCTGLIQTRKRTVIARVIWGVHDEQPFHSFQFIPLSVIWRAIVPSEVRALAWIVLTEISIPMIWFRGENLLFVFPLIGVQRV